MSKSAGDRLQIIKYIYIIYAITRDLFYWCELNYAFELWEDLKGEEYRAEKEKIASDATEKLEKLYPDVKGCVEVVDVATPLTDIRYTGVYRGAFEGFLPTSKNMTKTLSNTVKGLDNFYLAGQWLFPGGGLPPSAQSGKWLFQLITKKDKKKFRVSWQILLSNFIFSTNGNWWLIRQAENCLYS